MPDKNDVPLMYRAQFEGRSQLHRIYKDSALQEIAIKENIPPEQYSIRWVDQLLAVQSDGENPRNRLFSTDAPEETTQFQTKNYTISWRFVTNGGKDDGIIRPLIGAFGLPFYPGSSMKGAFKKACQQEEKAGRLPQGIGDRYCGKSGKNSEDDNSQPGILRFHGGYPVNQNWQKNLVDIVHPQQDFQVKENAKHSAYALISLYQPEMKFSISTTKAEETNWQQIWQIWENALGYGIGCRVSSGYGLSDKMTLDVLYQAKLHGEGAAAKLLNRQKEFRPNIFRAAIRGHALRIFGGLNQSLAEDIVDELFGGIRSGQEKVGLLGMAFQLDNLEWDFVNESDAYDVSGNLIWQLSGKLDNPEHLPCLKKLVEKLNQFAMLLGGFGKSWRRADHRIFYPKYTKHLIGCHWYWLEEEKNLVHSLDNVTQLIQETVNVAKEWMEKRGFELRKPPITAQSPTLTSTVSSNQNYPNKPQLKKPVPRPVKKLNQKALESEWREAWHSHNVQVWGRIAKTAEDSQIIPLLHSSPQSVNRQPQKGSHHNQPRQAQNQSIPLALQRGIQAGNQTSRPSIYRSCLTGRVKDEKKSSDPTEIGRLWHRMYPLKDGQYLELVTIFPKGCDEAEPFIKWLGSSKSGWKQLWTGN